MLKNKGQIWSETACRHIAADLITQAKKWEERAEYIAKRRSNLDHIEDIAPAEKAARRVLVAKQNGMDAMRECRTVCALNYLEPEQVWRLYRHKLARWEREERKKRNRSIKEQHMKDPNLTVRALAERFNLSHGQISKILAKA